MSRKRSRSNTEQNFQDAVLEIVAGSGCAQLGVNLIAQHAGADKVLIYRYFGGLDGLLQRVAESRSWLPTADELLRAVSGEPVRVLNELAQRVSQHVRGDAATHQLSRWRHAVVNPLTERYTEDWKTLWKELPEALSKGLDYEARQSWTHACALLALTIQAELNGEPVDRGSLDVVARELESPTLTTGTEATEEDEDVLPTNLL